MPTALSTINIAKEQAATYQPLLLAEFTFADGAVLRLSTHPLNVSEGGVQYGGNDYLGRISEQTIQQVQALSETGVDLVPSVSLSIADPVAYIYSNWETAAGRGFKGATLTLRLVFYDVAGGTFSSDSRIPFVGICEKPASDAAKITVSAVAKTSLMRAMLPIVPIQRRCPWINPTTTAQRAEAGNEDSCFYECGEARDTTTAPPCDYTLATCTQPTRFGGITYSAPAGMRVREYVSGNWSDVRGITNEASYGDRIPMLYGKAWIEPPVLTAIPDGNYLRGEVIVALGPVTIHKVLVNGIELSPANEPDGTPISGANPDFRYNWINDGTRDGSPNLDTPWSGTGDPYGSMSVIMFVLPRSQGGGDGVPRVRVLASRKDLRKYQALASVTVTSNVAVATLVGANVDIASNDPTWAFTISDTTGAALNAAWTGLTSWTSGPPGTFTFATTGVADGTYTGGYVRFKSATENAVWAIADLLTWTNYRYEDLDLASFCVAAQVLESRPTAIVLRQRRSAAEIIRSIRQAHGLLLVPEHSTGKLHIYVKQTLADQQPATISGSNYDTAVASKTAAGVTTNGYVAYKFDASSILRSDLPISLKELPRSQADSPNRISLSFQDRTNDYAVSTLSVVDSDDAGRLEGQEIAGSLAVNADGLTSYADAMRSARVNLAEIHRGNTAADTRGTRVFEWDTTVRASHLRVGHIVLMTDTLKGLTNQMLRITKIQPAQNYETVRLTAHWHDDNWYTDAYATTGALDATQYTPNAVSDASPLDIGGTVGSNLVRNAGFENGKAQWYGDIDNAAVTLVTDEYDTGLQSLKIEATGATEIHQPYDFQDGKYNVMPCVPGDPFTFKGRYKFAATSTATTAQARVAFYQADGTFISAETATLDPTDTTWTDFTLSATAPALAKYMGIFPWFGTLTAGAVYLDTLYCEKTQAAGVLPGHVSFAGVVTPIVEGVDQIELRAQVFNQFFVTAKAPNPLNGFNAVFVTHADADAIVTPIGRIKVDSPTAGAQFTVSFIHNAPKSTSTETITVLAASDYGTADAATAPTATVDATGKGDGADPPTGVTCTINEEDAGKYSITTAWTKPATEGGVIGYEILYEFYDAVTGLSFLITPFGGEDVIATIPASSILGYDIETHQSAPADRGAAQWVRSFVRSFSSFGKYSAWAYSTVTVLAGESVPQPAVGDWALGTVKYGANEKTQRAGLPVNLIALPTGVDYVTAWLEIDGQYRDVMSTATLGLNDIWIDQPRVATNYNCKLVGNRRNAVKMPSAANDVKTFSVAAWATPAVLTAFTVTLDACDAAQALRLGKTMYRLKYAVTGTTDVNRMGVAIFARWTDASWAAVAGDDGAWKEISWIKSTENSLTWYSSDDYQFPAPKTTNEYKQFAAVPKNYANEYVWAEAITQNATFTADGGWDTSAIDPTTLGTGLTLSSTGLENAVRGKLQNGDFELDGYGWTYYGNVSFVGGGAQFFGSKCAKIDGNTLASALYTTPGVVAMEGQSWRIEAMCKNTTNVVVYAHVNFFDAASAEIVAKTITIPIGAAYAPIELVTVAPALTAFVYINFIVPVGATSGSLFVDNVALTLLEPVGRGTARTDAGTRSTHRGALNTDFEDVDLNGLLCDWTVTDGVTVNTTDHYSGSRCAQITAAIGEYRGISQVVPAVPGRQFRWQAYCRETLDNGCYIAISFFNAAGAYISNVTTAISGDTWAAYEVVATAPALTVTTKVEVLTGNDSTTGRILVDQCQLIALEPIGGGIERTAASVKIDYATAEFSIVANELAVNGVPMSKATGFDTTAFQITGGTTFDVKEIAAAKIVTGTLGAAVVYAGAVNCSQLTAGTATFTGDVTLTRSGGASMTLSASSLFLDFMVADVTLNQDGISCYKGSFAGEVDAQSFKADGTTFASRYSASGILLSAYRVTCTDGFTHSGSTVSLTSPTNWRTALNVAEKLAITGAVIPLAKITAGGTDGSFTVNAAGQVTAYTLPT